MSTAMLINSNRDIFQTTTWTLLLWTVPVLVSSGEYSPVVLMHLVEMNSMFSVTIEQRFKTLMKMIDSWPSHWSTPLFLERTVDDSLLSLRQKPIGYTSWTP
jgi:hypothetical protein